MKVVALRLNKLQTSTVSIPLIVESKTPKQAPLLLRNLLPERTPLFLFLACILTLSPYPLAKLEENISKLQVNNSSCQREKGNWENARERCERQTYHSQGERCPLVAKVVVH